MKTSFKVLTILPATSQNMHLEFELSYGSINKILRKAKLSYSTTMWSRISATHRMGHVLGISFKKLVATITRGQGIDYYRESCRVKEDKDPLGRNITQIEDSKESDSENNSLQDIVYTLAGTIVALFISIIVTMVRRGMW